jgi:hypothetical protein
MLMVTIFRTQYLQKLHCLLHKTLFLHSATSQLLHLRLSPQLKDHGRDNALASQGGLLHTSGDNADEDGAMEWCSAWEN